MEPDVYAFRRIATTGCEIICPDGVIAWTVDVVWAARLVSLLNRDAGGDCDSGRHPATESGRDDELTEHRSP